MEVHRFHSWNVTPAEAIQIQEQIRNLVVRRGRVLDTEFVAGADAAFDIEANRIYAAVVVLRFPSLEPVETAVAVLRPSFPYVPGLLSFREAPALLHAFEKIRRNPDVIFLDGHGVSHPRAAGLACHIGICLNTPTIGCAKSRLIGTHRAPGPARGATAPLHDATGRLIGAVVRTRDRVKPVFVSVGHRLSLAQAVRLSLACGKGSRIPEPLRHADRLASRAKKDGKGDGLQSAERRQLAAPSDQHAASSGRPGAGRSRPEPVPARGSQKPLALDGVVKGRQNNGAATGTTP